MLNISQMCLYAILILGTCVAHVVAAAPVEVSTGICGVSIGDSWDNVKQLVSENYPSSDPKSVDTFLTGGRRGVRVAVQRHEVRFLHCDTVIRTIRNEAEGGEVDAVIETSTKAPYKVLEISFRPKYMSCIEWSGIFSSAVGAPTFISKEGWEWSDSRLNRRIWLHKGDGDECWLTFIQLPL